MTAPRIGGGHWPVDPGIGKVWGSNGAGSAVGINLGGGYQPSWDAQGLIAETGDPGLYANSTAPTTQNVYGKLFGLRAGIVVTGMMLRNSVAAAGTLPTTARFGLADSSGKFLVLSGNLNALANWAVGAMLFPFTAPYSILADGGYFACFVVNGVWGTTQPTPIRGSNQSLGQAGLPGKIPPNLIQGSQTDLPAVNSSISTTSPINVNYYMALY